LQRLKELEKDQFMHHNCSILTYNTISQISEHKN
jgi:hypothetical protein